MLREFPFLVPGGHIAPNEHGLKQQITTSSRGLMTVADHYGKPKVAQIVTSDLP
jgi:hypothetical protein